METDYIVAIRKRRNIIIRVAQQYSRRWTKMLLQHLDKLKAFGMVQKKQYEDYPLRVEYSLTEKGLI